MLSSSQQARRRRVGHLLANLSLFTWKRWPWSRSPSRCQFERCRRHVPSPRGFRGSDLPLFCVVRPKKLVATEILFSRVFASVQQRYWMFSASLNNLTPSLLKSWVSQRV